MLVPLLYQKISKLTTGELADALRERGVVASPIYRANEMVSDPQVVHRGLHFDVPHRTIGSVPLVASPMNLSKTPIDVYQAPPEIGQHTDEVLSGLGYSGEAIADLKAGGII